MTRLVLAAGSTETAAIDGISAAGATPELLAHTPSADAELLAYGQPVRTSVVPVSPTGCPTPAALTRAAREVVGFPLTVVDAGLAARTGAPTVSVGAQAGSDIRTQDPVPTAPGAFAAAREFGRAIPDSEIMLAESIPGGTTTALGVLRALGEHGAVSSSLPTNPIERKETVVEEALAASSLDAGGAAGEPKVALRRMGDPVLAVVAGLAKGALETDTAVTLAGGSQQLAVAAVLRHAGVEAPLSLATTSYVAADDSAAVESLADSLEVDMTVTDPNFAAVDHPATDAYEAGEAKEGVGMGGALALAARVGQVEAVRDRFVALTDELVDDSQEADTTDTTDAPDATPRDAGDGS